MMNNIFKSFFNFIKNHKLWSALILIVVLVLVWYFLVGGKKEENTDFVTVETGTIKEEVSVTGNVKPLSDVDLAFERGGRVSTLNVAVGNRVYVGQILASVSNADLVANLNQAQANLKKIKAGLGSATDQTNLNLSQSRTSLFNTIKDSYTKADDALRNKIFSLFDDPVRYNARLSFSTDSFLQEDIEDGKDIANDALDSWSRSLNKINENADLEAEYKVALTNLNLIKALLNDSAEAVNSLASDDYTSQIEIDTWKLNISTARTSINTAISALTSSFDQFKSAGLSLKLSEKDILIEEASVEQAQAQVASAEAELAKTIIRSPINGVVTDIPVKLGEIVSLNQKAISVISYGDYQVESFIPEADISKIKIGNKARTTLDAYGSDIEFETVVIKIDPAATVIDGVPTYKVTLRFTDQDDRILSGMTANLDILTSEKTNVLAIPTRAVYSKDDGKYVKVLLSDGSSSEIKIVVGLRGFDGRVEVVSGLEAGQKVSTSI